MFPTILNRNTTTGRDITLENIFRHSGVYVLGKSRMGKSVLLASIASQDDNNKCGFFFLDPHGDVTNTLTPYLWCSAAIVLNVEDETHSFGINLLSCRNKDSLQERTATYTHAYNAFEKIDELLELIALLQKPENHIKVQSRQYIEKPKYTRTTHDMTREMVQTLTSLPRYTAMVKLMGNTQSEKYTMQTRGIEAPRHGHPVQRFPDITRPRVEILADILRRQTQWQTWKPQPEPSAPPQTPPRRDVGRPPPSVL